MSDQTGAVPTSSVLFAVHKQLQRRCADKTAAFLACKKADQDPEKCLHAGAAMTGCMVDLLKDLRKKCPEELNAYASCLDYRSNNLDKCRAAQEAFESKCPL